MMAETGTAIKSLLCDFTGAVRVRGRSRWAEASWKEGDWVVVDGVLVSRESIYAEVGEQMVQDVLEGRNSCCFTYGEEDRGQREVMGGTGSTPGLMAQVTEHLLRKVDSINQSGSHQTACLQLSCFSLSEDTADVTDLLDASPDTNIGNYSVWEDPLRGPVVPDVSSVLLQSADQLAAATRFSTPASLFAAATMQAPPHAHTVYQATLFKATKSDGDDVEHQISNLRLVLTSQRKGNTGFVGLQRIVDGLLAAQTDTSLLVSLRGLVKAHVLTYLLCECLGGNCVTTALGFLGDDREISADVLKFSRDARQLKGIVRQNRSHHEAAVTEISWQIEQAEEKLKQAAEGGQPNGKEREEDTALSTPNWASSIALRKEAIGLLAKLKNSCLSHARFGETDLSAVPVGSGVQQAQPAGSACRFPALYHSRENSPEAIAAALRTENRVLSQRIDELERELNSHSRAPSALTGPVAKENYSLRTQVAVLTALTQQQTQELKQRPGRGSGGVPPARDVTGPCAAGAAQETHGLSPSGSSVSLRREASDARRVAELEKEVAFLSSRLRDERSETQRLQDTIQGLKGHERLAEERLNARWMEIKDERDKMREEMQKKKLAMQHVIHEKSDAIQQRMQDMEIENAALHEERRVLFRILQDGKKQYERLKREVAKVGGSIWRPTGGGTSSAAKALQQAAASTNHANSATHSTVSTARRGRQAPANGQSSSHTHTSPSPAAASRYRSQSNPGSRSSSRKGHANTVTLGAVHAGGSAADDLHQKSGRARKARAGRTVNSQSDLGSAYMPSAVRGIMAQAPPVSIASLSPPPARADGRALPIGEYDKEATKEHRYAGRSASPTGSPHITREEILTAKMELQHLQDEVAVHLREFEKEDSADSLANTQPAVACSHWRDELAAFEKSLDTF